MKYTTIRREAESKFDYALGVVPPSVMRTGKHGVFGFLMGEPLYHSEGIEMFEPHFSERRENGDVRFYSGPSMSISTFLKVIDYPIEGMKALYWKDGRPTLGQRHEHDVDRRKIERFLNIISSEIVEVDGKEYRQCTYCSSSTNWRVLVGSLFGLDDDIELAKGQFYFGTVLPFLKENDRSRFDTLVPAGHSY